MNQLERALRVAPSASPEEATLRFRRRALAEGLVDVAYAPMDSPFGTLLLAGTDQGLVRLAYPDEGAEAVLAELTERLSPRLLEAPSRLDSARRQLDQYFEGRRRSFELTLDWSLTAGFGRRVLQATAAIPFGRVTTYGDLALASGSPRAARAVGNALGRNPIPVVVPCHRVVRAGGALGGYTGGVDRKRYLLELEGVAPASNLRL